MSVEVWQNLPKAQDDPETIEEAIDRKITAHLADVNAHLGENESLATHRASEIIDHLAESIVNDKLSDSSVSEDKFLLSKTSYQTNFDILDPFTIVNNSGYVYGGIGGLTIISGPNLNDHSQVRGNSSGFSVWAATRNPVLTFVLASEFDYDQEGYFVMGRLGHLCFGFKFDDNSLYCYLREFNGTEHTLEVSGIILPFYNIYQIKALTSGTIEYYVNGSLVGSFSDISLSDLLSVFDFYIKNTNNESKGVRITNLNFYQDRNYF